MRTLIVAGQGGSVRNYGAASFSIYFSFLIFLMVCCKQGLVAEAEAVLSFIIF